MATSLKRSHGRTQSDSSLRPSTACSTVCLSPTQAAPLFDTPSSYFDSIDEEAIQRSNKRRKLVNGYGLGVGVVDGCVKAAGKVLSASLDAALFGTAVGFAAYQVWKSRSTPSSPHTVDTLQRELPKPPMRQVRHVHFAKSPAQRRSAPPVVSTPELSTNSSTDSDSDEEEDEDAAFVAVSQRIRAMIDEGNQALHRGVEDEEVDDLAARFDEWQRTVEQSQTTGWWNSQEPARFAAL